MQGNVVTGHSVIQAMPTMVATTVIAMVTRFSKCKSQHVLSDSVYWNIKKYIIKHTITDSMQVSLKKLKSEKVSKVVREYFT